MLHLDTRAVQFYVQYINDIPSLFYSLSYVPTDCLTKYLSSGYPPTYPADALSSSFTFTAPHHHLLDDIANCPISIERLREAPSRYNLLLFNNNHEIISQHGIDHVSPKLTERRCSRIWQHPTTSCHTSSFLHHNTQHCLSTKS